MDILNGCSMNATEKILREIEGLEGLLVQAQRYNQSKYIREIRRDIEGLQRELRIQKVKGSRG